MSKLIWDQTGERFYETGVDHGVLYPVVGTAYPKGVAWNGLSSISESPEGAEANDIYADNIKYLSMRSAENLKATIEAYTYPDEFAILDGSAEITTGVMIGQQSRKAFGLCYRTILGNDTEQNDYGYKIHILYGCTASPSQKQYQTVNDSPEAAALSWDIDTTPVNVTGFKPTASLVIDSTKVEETKLKALEAVLYGTDGEGEGTGTNARLPLPDEIISILA